MLTYFELPWMLAVAPIAALAVAALVRYTARRRAARLGRFGEPALLARLVAGGIPRGSLTRRTVLLAGAALTAGLALAGPRWGFGTEEIHASGIDIVLALDASLSMLATDDRPSRLEKMKAEVRRLRAESPGDRIGLIVFAGRSYILSPLTTDEGALELFLGSLEPSIVGQPGSSLAAAIRQGTALLQAGTSGADRALVVMSDGEAFESTDDLQAAARAAGRAGVSVVFVGFGTEAGSTIPNDSGGEKRDQNGQVVVTRYHPEILRGAAEAAGGTFIAATETDKTTRIRRALASLTTRRQSVERSRDLSPRFQWLVLPMLLLLAIDTILSERRQRLPSAPRRVAGSTTTARIVIALLLLTPRAGRADAVTDAVRAYRAGHYVEAVAAFRQASQANADDPRLLYDLGTALLAADSLTAAADVFDRAERLVARARPSDTSEVRYRILFNEGLTQLRRGLRLSGTERDAPLDRALAAYRKALTLRSSDADAQWNYELALRERRSGGGGGGGGGGLDNASPAPAAAQQQPQPRQEQASGQLSHLQAEALLNSAEREEREVQDRRQPTPRPGQTVTGKDW